MKTLRSFVTAKTFDNKEVSWGERLKCGTGRLSKTPWFSLVVKALKQRFWWEVHNVRVVLS